MTTDSIQAESAHTLLWKGSELLKTDALAAVEFARSAVKDYPENPKLHSLLGQSADRVAEGMRTAGQQTYMPYKNWQLIVNARASDLAPDVYLNAQFAATCMLGVSDTAGFTYAVRATNLERQNFRAWFKLAQFYNRLGKVNHAAVCFRNTLRLLPDHKQSVINWII